MTTSTTAPYIKSAVDSVVESVVDPLAEAIRNVSNSVANRVSRFSSSNRSGLGTGAVVLLGLGVAVAGGIYISRLVARAAQRKEQQGTEARHDKALKETFPASDPPASQYFDIPVNRQ